MKLRMVLVVSAVLGLGTGCSSGGGAEPVPFDVCGEVTCGEGLFCEEVDGEGSCRCDETSCGEGYVCGEGQAVCEEAVWTGCVDGEEYVEGACRCDESRCVGDFACSEDGARCELAGVEEACVTGELWDGETALFEEVSAEVGLRDLGVEAVRLSAVDLNGDGAAELIARRSGFRVHEFGEEGVPSFWLLENDGAGNFEDVTEASGILARRDGNAELGRPAEVVAFGDVNNDGFVDVVTAFSGREEGEGAEVMLGDGTGTFSAAAVSEDLHRAGVEVAVSGLSLVDVDRDGNLDLWVTQAGQQNLLLKGDGTGRFEDVTAQVGLQTSSSQTVEILNQARHHGHAWSGLACDLNNDGLSELLAGNYGRAPNHLWVGAEQSEEGEGVWYENQSISSGYAFDERQDWTDNESARCYCKLNPEAEDCEGVPEPELIRCVLESDVFRWNHAFDREPFRLGGNSGTTVCADLNGDGRLDLLTTEIVHWDVGSSSDPSEILYNAGDGALRFERPGNEVTGLVRSREEETFDDGDITAAVIDVDRDGRLDLVIASTDYPGTRAYLYHQQVDGTFASVEVDLGIDLTSAHGIAVADFDGDGWQDIAIGHSRNRCSSGDHCQEESHVRLFRNRGVVGSNHLAIELKGGEGMNRSAIGAQLLVSTPEVTRRAYVDGGHGHYGMQHEMTSHFGLGSSCEAWVEVRWPDREQTTERYRLKGGQRYELSPGEAPRVR